MASHRLREQSGAPNAIGEKVGEIWRELYHMPGAFDPERDFERLFADGDRFAIGALEARVMLSPGHPLGSISYVVGDAVFARDTFMQPDARTSRADFPGGSARTLYRSLRALLALPDEHRLFIGHDYGTDEREEPAWKSTDGEQRAYNKHVGGDVPEEEFVARRERRDRTLSLPDRMSHAL